MAIRQPDSEPFNYLDYFGGSQVILVPIHENRIGEEGYEQMLREARLFADTYDKILVGVLEAYCTYSSHPILGNIPVVPTGQAGSGTVPRPLTLYDSREDAWRAVAQGLAEVLAPYRLFFQPGIRGSVYFDKEENAWCFDKGRKDGVSIWHRVVALQAQSGTLELPIKQVLPTKTYFGQLAGFDPEPSQVFRASIAHPAERNINILAEDHAGNAALIRELTEDENLQRQGINWTKDIPGLDFVLHFTQTHCYLTRAFEDTNDSSFDLFLNPYRPLTKLIELNSGLEIVREMLKQVANWAFLRQLEAPYSEQVNEDALEITVFHSQGKEWEALVPQDGWVHVPLWAKQQKGGVNYENTIRIQLANRTEMPLYVSAFWLTNYLGSSAELTEDVQIELKPGEQTLLPQREPGSIFVELDSRTLAYNLPYKTLEVKFLASLQPFSTDGFWMGNLPGPPGSFFREEEGYFMEKARPAIRVRPLSGEWIAPRLKLRLDNPAYNRPQPNLLDNLLRRPETESFFRALYFESFHLAPRYQLKQQMDLQDEGPSGSGTVQATPQPYVHTPDGLAILEYQLQQLRPQLQGKAEKPILVALGDSWFNQAAPVDIPHFLMEDFVVLHAPLQDWGQLEEAVRRVGKRIGGAPSVTLLLSPMGERVMDHLEDLVKVNAAEDTDNIRDILTEEFMALIEGLEKEWFEALRPLSGFEPKLKVVIHSYDYFPLDQFGGVLYRRPQKWRRNLADFILDILNEALKSAVKEAITFFKAANIHYLDLRNTLEPQDWVATLIPAATGFRKLAGAVSLFIDRQYQWEEEPYPGTEYFLWQVAKMSETVEAYQQLIDAYPEGERREWAEGRMRELQPESPIQSQSQSFEPEAVQPQEPDALQSLRRRANQLISSNQLAGVFQLLDRELRQDAEPRERLVVYRKELTQLERQGRRYKRPIRQLDRDIASLADAVGELVEGLTVEDLRDGGRRTADGGNQGRENESTIHESPSHPLTSSPKTGSFTDPRDGRTYRTVELNGLVWMAENLNFDVGEGCWHYNHDPEYGERYGRLYTWEAAYWACPSGWRLPTDEEWKALMDSFGDGKVAYEALIEGGESGFDAVLGGRRTIRGSFYDMESLGGYWSGTEKGTQEVWCYYFHSDTRIMSREDFEQSRGFSCRCVRAAGGSSI
ncbi:MAG: hypothetical protein H6557_30680 [Lewinellaceae bacterium]|nr:hypothetical protein [Phaeodactylibacter sp.]MCB9041015.1 hypothetical protein [Lewinellaceae bacterium]